MRCSKIGPSRLKDQAKKITLKPAKTQNLSRKKGAISSITKNKNPVLQNRKNESSPVLQAEAATPKVSAKPAKKARAKAEVEAEVGSANIEEEARAEKTTEEDTLITTKETEIVKKNQERIDTGEIPVMTEKTEERTTNLKKIEGCKRKKISIIVKSQRKGTKTIAGKKTDTIAMTNEETSRMTEEK